MDTFFALAPGLLPLALGFILDLCFGDPLWLPHPVMAIGRLISVLEKLARRLFPATPKGELAGGAAALHFRQLDGDVVARLDLDQ